jgi:hypothetical protein
MGIVSPITGKPFGSASIAGQVTHAVAAIVTGKAHALLVLPMLCSCDDPAEMHYSLIEEYLHNVCILDLSSEDSTHESLTVHVKFGNQKGLKRVKLVDSVVAAVLKIRLLQWLVIY